MYLSPLIWLNLELAHTPKHLGISVCTVFIKVNFEDFNFDELKVILERRITEYKWTLEDSRAVDVAARRIARGREIKGMMVLSLRVRWSFQSNTNPNSFTN